jgi:hypothetical protein
LRDLGTWGQQIAEFPSAKAGIPWHGYPIWAVNQEAPDNRKGEKMRPAKQVFEKLEAPGLGRVDKGGVRAEVWATPATG